jgi:hypothetical protein
MIKNQQQESGAVVIIVLFCLFFIIAVLAIVIDIGKLEATIRSIQHSADAASIAAANTLNIEDSDLNNLVTGENTEASRYANVKRIVLLILSQNETMGLDETAKRALGIGGYTPTMSFNSGTITNSNPDWSNQNYDTAEAGNLKVTVRRQIHCFEGTNSAPVRNNYDLDGTPNSLFCRANQVVVTITVSNVKTFFGAILSVREFNDISATSASFAHQRVPNSAAAICSSTNCDALGIDFGNLTAAACRGRTDPTN